MEEWRQLLDDQIYGLVFNDSISLKELNLFLKRFFSGVTVEDIRTWYPDIHIIVDEVEEHPASDLAEDEDRVVMDIESPSREQLESNLPTRTTELLGNIREQLILKDLVKAKALLAQLEASYGDEQSLPELRKALEALIVEIENLQIEIGRLESAEKYYELKRKIDLLEISFPKYPGLNEIKLKTEDKIKVAESYLNHARRTSAGKEKVNYYLHALDACKDCAEAISALSLLPPDAPTNLQIEQQPNCISLKWASPASDLGVVYRLLKKKGDPPTHPEDGEVLAEMTNQHYNDTNVLSGESYSYGVFSMRGGISSTSSASTGPLLFVAEVLEASIVPGYRKVHLRWQLPSNVKGVEIFRSLNNAPSRRVIGDAFARLDPVKEFIDKDVYDNITYGYLICTIFEDYKGFERFSNGIKLSAKTLTPPLPISTLEVKLDAEQFHLKWEASSNNSIIIVVSDQPLNIDYASIIDEAKVTELGQLLMISEDTKYATYSPQRVGQHYFTPISVSNGLGVIGKNVNVNYLPPLTNPQFSIGGKELFLEWNWPAHSSWAHIEYCNDLFVFERADTREMVTKVISRKDYEINQGFALKNLEKKPYFIRLFNLPSPDANPMDWSKPLVIEVDNSTEIGIKYHIKLNYNLFGKLKGAFLHISCPEFDKIPDNVPALELLYKTGGIPVQKESGKLILSVSRFQLTKPDISIELSNEFLGANRYAKLFFEHDAIKNLRLYHPSRENLQLF